MIQWELQTYADLQTWPSRQQMHSIWQDKTRIQVLKMTIEDTHNSSRP
jgi:hypothetical protein